MSRLGDAHLYGSAIVVVAEPSEPLEIGFPANVLHRRRCAAREQSHSQRKDPLTRALCPQAFTRFDNRADPIGAYIGQRHAKRLSYTLSSLQLPFTQHIVHFAEKFLRSVRLAYETTVIGNFCLSGLDPAGSDDQEDAGPPSMNLSR
jgi:hypothetical protein